VFDIIIADQRHAHRLALSEFLFKLPPTEESTSTELELTGFSQESPTSISAISVQDCAASRKGSEPPLSSRVVSCPSSISLHARGSQDHCRLPG
jgi:hypothetical protein